MGVRSVPADGQSEKDRQNFRPLRAPHPDAPKHLSAAQTRPRPSLPGGGREAIDEAAAQVEGNNNNNNKQPK